MSKVLVGLSGGVDSSVAIILLKNRGYEVIGVNFNLCGDKNTDAKNVAYDQSIEYHEYDFTQIFKEKIIDYFSNEYIKGGTPNPCIRCNSEIKFNLMLKLSKELGSDFIATGHYANICNSGGRYFLKTAKDIGKDQSYMLYKLRQEELSHTLMPLGDYTKKEIRQIARENNLITADKKDSEDICFIKDNNYVKFIKENYNYIPKKGYIKDINGRIVGEHSGLINYTIGQRRGLGVALGRYQYVINIDILTNTLTIGDEKFLYRKKMLCRELNFMAIDDLEGELEVMIKTRYKAKPSLAKIYKIDKETVEINFYEEQKLVSEGQSAVFYNNDTLIGGGVIVNCNN